MAVDRHHRSQAVDPKVWQACAGSCAEIPAVQSRVFYFPQGHMEHSSAPIPSSSFPPSLGSFIHCNIISVLYLANPDTDEVFTRIRLEPIPAPWNNTTTTTTTTNTNTNNNDNDNVMFDDDHHQRSAEENGIVSFAKVLTQSDANNGGGFSVPRFCADSIFPALDFAADPPVQNIRIKDVHGKSWEFRHIYRGVPRRHLLTTGWSKFVNSKKLIAGDSVVFMRNKANGELTVGVRRALKSTALGDFAARLVPHLGMLGEGTTIVVDEAAMRNKGEKAGVFSRNGKGKVPPDAIVEAANRAASGLPFEVVYYPRVGSPNFVVAFEKVWKATNCVGWCAGARVKMAMETEDSSRMTWFQGTVSSVVVPDNGLWRGSPWRMLQVTWDEPDVLQNVKKVSPWEVEYVASTPSLADIFPSTKKLKESHNPVTLNEGERQFSSSPWIGFGNSVFGQFSSSQLSYPTFPVGMQGARQNTMYISPLYNIGTHQWCAVNYAQHTMTSKNDDVSTDLTIGTSSKKTLHLFGQNIRVEDDIPTRRDDFIQPLNKVKKNSVIKA